VTAYDSHRQHCSTSPTSHCAGVCCLHFTITFLPPLCARFLPTGTAQGRSRPYPFPRPDRWQWRQLRVLCCAACKSQGHPCGRVQQQRDSRQPCDHPSVLQRKLHRGYTVSSCCHSRNIVTSVQMHAMAWLHFLQHRRLVMPRHHAQLPAPGSCFWMEAIQCRASLSRGSLCSQMLNLLGVDGTPSYETPCLNSWLSSYSIPLLPSFLQVCHPARGVQVPRQPPPGRRVVPGRKHPGR
jgi:hypothetical protein